MTTTPVYISQRGVIACAQHGGEYLLAAIRGRPGSTRYLTPLDSWVRCYEGYGLCCEECAKA